MSVYNPEAFSERVSYAIQCIERGTDTRTFYTCFEMNDGDAVVVAIYRRLQHNPPMLNKMWQRLCPCSVMPRVEQYSATPTRKLHELARTLRNQ